MAHGLWRRLQRNRFPANRSSFARQEANCRRRHRWRLTISRPGGYAQWSKFLAAILIEAQGSLLRGTRVTAVRWKRNRVEIDCVRLGQPCVFYGKSTIISLPLGILQSGALQFLPGPAEIAHVVKQMRMGHVWRAVMLFRDRFWAMLKDANGAALNELSFLFSSPTNPSTWWTPYPEGSKSRSVGGRFEGANLSHARAR